MLLPHRPDQTAGSPGSLTPQLEGASSSLPHPRRGSGLPHSDQEEASHE